MPAESTAQRYLEQALRSVPDELAQLRSGLFPRHRAQVAFELAKLELGLLPRPAPEIALRSSELPHSPILLARTARTRAFAYAVHRRAFDPAGRNPAITLLLIYLTRDNTVDFLELQRHSYTVLLALELASENRCPLVATELLLELTECCDVENIVQFVEQEFKLLSRLNELGLITRPQTASVAICGPPADNSATNRPGSERGMR